MVEPGPEVVAEPEPEPEPELEAEPKVVAEPDVVAAPEPEPEPEPARESQPDPVAEPESERETRPVVVGGDQARTGRSLRRGPALVAAALIALLVANLVLLYLVIARDDSPQGGSDLEATPTVVLRPPASLPATGSLDRVRVLGRGDLQVTQWVRSGAGLDRVVLSAPDPSVGSGSVKASGLVVVADGSRVPGPGTVGDDPQVFTFQDPAQLVRVTYRLSGVVERSPDVPGRALLRATALRLTATPADGPARVELTGAPVLSVACVAQGSTALPVPCGSASSGGWTVERTPDRRADGLVAQVQLPVAP